MAGPQRFFDQSQPQTLQIATFLLYLDAALLFLGGALFGSLLGMALTAGCAGGAVGMANQRKWGYSLSVGVAVLSLAWPFLQGNTLDDVVKYGTISLMFSVALVCLLMHPHSREYQRIWFS